MKNSAFGETPEMMEFIFGMFIFGILMLTVPLWFIPYAAYKAYKKIFN